MLSSRMRPSRIVATIAEKSSLSSTISAAARDLGSALTHCDADVRPAQRRCVVYPVACHRDDLTRPPQGVDNRIFLLWTNAREDAAAADQPVEGWLVNAVELSAGDDTVVAARDSSGVGDRMRRERMVAGNQLELHPGTLASRNSVRNRGPKRIAKAEQAEQSKPAFV